MTLNSHFLSGFIVLTMLFATSCQKAEPHRTQSEYFNSLLDSAPIHVIDIDTPANDTLYFSDGKTYCVDGFLGDQGVRSISNMHLFNDSIYVLADVNAKTLWALDTLGRVTQIARSGNGPGEVFIPQFIQSLEDTLFVYDYQFVHAFDQNLKFMYRYQSVNYATVISKMLINPTIFMTQASINEPGVRFNVFDRSKDSLAPKHAIFDLIIDRKTSEKFKLPFNQVLATLSVYDNTLLFYYYSSPYVFISDEYGKISDIIRFESPELMAAEPTYADFDYLQVDQQNTGQGDFVPDREKLGKFAIKMTDFKFLANGDIQFVYRSTYLITLEKTQSGYQLADKKIFSSRQNKENKLYIQNVFQRNNGDYTGYSRLNACIVNS
jgi:hypothetical protein